MRTGALQSSAVRTGGLTSVSCVFAVLDGAWQRVSRLTVVPRGLHPRYLCADRFDTANTTRGISTTLLRISGADEHRYARYGRASTTDTADISTERMVSRCIKTASEGYRTNEKARRSGPSVQGLMSRISSQHHRCNGKSFQCPSNVTTFRGYTLLWASALLSFPCTCYYAPILADRNSISSFAAELFVYLRKCSTAHPNAAILRIRVRIEPVRMCDYVRTERHAGRTGPAALPPTNLFRTKQYQNTHSTTPLMSLEPSSNQRGAGRHALPTAELSVTRRLADRSGISAISRM